MNRIRNFRTICTLLDRIVEDETKGNNELAIRVLDRHQKAQDIVRIRERILRRARTEIWETKPSSSRWEVCSAFGPPTPSWRPLGYLKIALILGGNHSSWVKMAKMIDISPIQVEPQLQFTDVV